MAAKVTSRSARLAAALFLALAVLFLGVNRHAYSGYFSADDFDNLANARQNTLEPYLSWFFSLRFTPLNFRPTGHFMYFVMQRLAGLQFPAYVALIQAVHLLNAWLLWLVLRRLKLSQIAASAGALFFAFELAVFDVFWKPMYLFDLFCCLFCLLALLAYLYRRIVLSLIAFWFAYKAKEVAVMLPLVLAVYELGLGDRRWRRLVPFFLISAIFGLQGLFLNPHRNDPYTPNFAPWSVIQVAWWYLWHIPGVRWACLLFLLLPFLGRGRLLHFGFATLGILLLPMLFLPGRINSVYLYVPFIGMSVVVGVAASRARPVPLAAIFAVWLSWNYIALQRYQQAKLADDAEVRTWVTTATQFVRAHPEIRTYVYDGRPESFQDWGLRGVLRYCQAPGPEPQLLSSTPDHGPVGVLHWDRTRHELATAIK